MSTQSDFERDTTAFALAAGVAFIMIGWAMLGATFGTKGVLLGVTLTFASVLATVAGANLIDRSK